MTNIRVSKLLLLCLTLVTCLAGRFGATTAQDTALAAKNPSLRRLQATQGAAVAPPTGVAAAGGTGATPTPTRSSAKDKILKAYAKFRAWAKSLLAKTKPAKKNSSKSKTATYSQPADTSKGNQKPLLLTNSDSTPARAGTSTTKFTVDTATKGNQKPLLLTNSDSTPAKADKADDFQDAQTEFDDDFQDAQTEFGVEK